MRKTCTLCHRQLEPKFFNKNIARADGLQSACRDCNKEKSRAYYRTNNAQHKVKVLANKQCRIKQNQGRLREYLLCHPCVDCGEEDLVVLEFDHVKGVKLRDVCGMVQAGYSWTKILAEVAKCEVRCANCHRRKTARTDGYHSWRTFS
jgi:hypothetical protein